MIIPITFNLLSVTARYPVAITQHKRTSAERVKAWQRAHKAQMQATQKAWRERKARV